MHRPARVILAAAVAVLAVPLVALPGHAASSADYCGSPEWHGFGASSTDPRSGPRLVRAGRVFS